MRLYCDPSKSAALVRRNGVADLVGNTLLSELFRDFGTTNGGHVFNDDGLVNHALALHIPVDVLEQGDEYFVRANVPGCQAEDIEVVVKENWIHIEGHRKDEPSGSYLLQERPTGKFARRIQLPKAADTENMVARTNNGVLEITVPKKEEAKPKKIPVR